MSEFGARPGPWLRLIAVGAAAAAALAVVSGALSLHTAHRALAALAVPPLAALVAAAWVAHRRLLAPSAAALRLFAAAPPAVGRPLHVALAAALVATAATFRGDRVPAAPFRDYLTLTKPRIMSLLLLTGACGMIVGAGGFPAPWLFVVTMVGLGLACGGASALNHVLDRDIDPHMRRTARPPVPPG